MGSIPTLARFDLDEDRTGRRAVVYRYCVSTLKTPEGVQTASNPSCRVHGTPALLEQKAFIRMRSIEQKWQHDVLYNVKTGLHTFRLWSRGLEKLDSSVKTTSFYWSSPQPGMESPKTLAAPPLATGSAMRSGGVAEVDNLVPTAALPEDDKATKATKRRRLRLSAARDERGRLPGLLGARPWLPPSRRPAWSCGPPWKTTAWLLGCGAWIVAASRGPSRSPWITVTAESNAAPCPEPQLPTDDVCVPPELREADP
ncbi:hypothetical protein HPB47_025741 [Ixodes persulcatus]|uniref:Uncharacterized protein n=1 Tax=Ixodes persulcatus TaxID=34615 RepID=A0AC60Q0R3_IXOPE|nr:hypothetical protein HPB47_025741 [Ixodes persulcatus]